MVQDWLRARCEALLAAILGRTWAKIVVLAFAAVALLCGVYDLAVAQWLPPETAKDMPRVYDVIVRLAGALTMWLWISFGLGILFVVTLEYAVRLRRKLIRMPALGSQPPAAIDPEVQRLLALAREDDRHAGGYFIADPLANSARSFLDAPEPYIDLSYCFRNCSVFEVKFLRVEGAIKYKGHDLTSATKVLNPELSVLHGAHGTLTIRQPVTRDTAKDMLADIHATLHSGNFAQFFQYRNHEGQQREFRIGGPNIPHTIAADPSILRPPIRFFTNREELNEATGSLNKRLDGIYGADMLLVIGDGFFSGDKNLDKVKRLILPNPDKRDFEAYVKTRPGRANQDRIKDIARQALKAGIDVKYSQDFYFRTMILADAQLDSKRPVMAAS